MTAWVLLLAAAYIAYKLYDHFRGPHAANQAVTMKVWAAFGPYDTANDAAKFLRHAATVVFGSAVPTQEEWLQRHIQNFREWEQQNSFSTCENMRSILVRSGRSAAVEHAYRRMRNELADELASAAAFINEQFLEEGGHRLEVVRRPDGSAVIEYKQIWPDEAIQQKEREDGE